MTFHPTCYVPLLMAALVCLSSRVGAQNAPVSGQARVCRWQGDRKAAFLLMFDDNCASDVKTVFPEMKQRGLVGTYYVNPGKGEWAKFKAAWENGDATPGSELANHTMTHKGVKDIDHARKEIGDCSKIIRQMMYPDAKTPPLLSYGQPGVAKGAWNISKDELNTILKEDNLIDRPPFSGRGATINLKTTADILAHIDKAVAKGNCEAVVFHGVGGDWFPFPVDQFTSLLDTLVARKDEIWVTTHIAAHKYETQRNAATVNIVSADAKRIRLSLTCSADPKLYDGPLTLAATVPWKQCKITQGGRDLAAVVGSGEVLFDALPGDQPIVIEPAN